MYGEKFKEIDFSSLNFKKKYAISNKGRLVSFTDDILKGSELVGTIIDGYRFFKYSKYTKGKRKTSNFFIGKLVAEYFIPKTSDEQKYVLHLDYKRDNDVVENLKWATYEEMLEHGQKSPHVIKAKEERLLREPRQEGPKLNATKVMRLKKILLDPNRKTRLKIIAKQFNISLTQIDRIRRGENWGHIKVDIKDNKSPE